MTDIISARTRASKKEQRKRRRRREKGEGIGNVRMREWWGGEERERREKHTTPAEGLALNCLKYQPTWLGRRPRPYTGPIGSTKTIPLSISALHHEANLTPTNSIWRRIRLITKEISVQSSHHAVDFVEIPRVSHHFTSFFPLSCPHYSCDLPISVFHMFFCPHLAPLRLKHSIPDYHILNLSDNLTTHSKPRT